MGEKEKGIGEMREEREKEGQAKEEITDSGVNSRGRIPDVCLLVPVEFVR